MILSPIWIFIHLQQWQVLITDNNHVYGRENLSQGYYRFIFSHSIFNSQQKIKWSVRLLHFFMCNIWIYWWLWIPILIKRDEWMRRNILPIFISFFFCMKRGNLLCNHRMNVRRILQWPVTIFNGKKEGENPLNET